jgi:hypothetical protein
LQSGRWSFVRGGDADGTMSPSATQLEGRPD